MTRESTLTSGLCFVTTTQRAVKLGWFQGLLETIFEMLLPPNGKPTCKCDVHFWYLRAENSYMKTQTVP